MRTLMAKFAHISSEYHYVIPEGDNPQPGDFIVTTLQPKILSDSTRTAYPALKDGFQIAQVISLDDRPHPSVKRVYYALLPKAQLTDRKELNKNYKREGTAYPQPIPMATATAPAPTTAPAPSSLDAVVDMLTGLARQFSSMASQVDSLLDDLADRD